VEGCGLGFGDNGITSGIVEEGGCGVLACTGWLFVLLRLSVSSQFFVPSRVCDNERVMLKKKKSSLNIK